MAAYSFGITPVYDFNDTSGLVVGEAIALNTAALDYRESYVQSISASLLNSYIVDVSVGDVSGASALKLATDPSDISLTDITLDSNVATFLSHMAKASVKATIAKAITGEIFGDIGELENDTTFDDLFDASNYKAALATSISGPALISLAEDIIRNTGLSDISSGGRDPANPFLPGDIYDFNFLIRNGNIELVLDPISSINDSSANVEFFSGPLEKAGVGLTGFSANAPFVVNDGATYPLSNVYISGAAGGDRFTTANNIKTSEDVGYYPTQTNAGGVIVMMRLTIQ